MAVTVNVCGPGCEVSSGAPDWAPFSSMHDEIPEPPAPSVHVKLVGTDCPTAYVPPGNGEETDAVGGATAVSETAVAP